MASCGPSSRIQLKRAYAEVSDDDGYRILVDRLWPRGLSKDKARLDLWFKDIAPSPALRVWFGHDPARFEEFGHRYVAELERRPAEVAKLRDILAKTPATFVYAAKDPRCNHAIVLRAYMEDRGGK